MSTKYMNIINYVLALTLLSGMAHAATTHTSIGSYCSNSEILYAYEVGPEMCPPTGQACFYRSMDGGSTWNLKGSPMLGTWKPSQCLIDSTNSDTIYCTGASQHLTSYYAVKSTDGGATWRTIFYNTKTYGNLGLLGLDSTRQSLYLNTSNAVLKSTDGGTSWSPTNDVDAASVSSWASNPCSNHFLYTGSQVHVRPDQNVSLQFDSVTGNGIISAIEKESAAPPSNTRLIAGTSYEISTTASYTGSIQISISYNDSSLVSRNNEHMIKLFHHNGKEWENVTTSVDTINNIVYGRVTTLSPFTLAEPTPAIPATPVGGFGVSLTIAISMMTYGIWKLRN